MKKSNMNNLAWVILALAASGGYANQCPYGRPTTSYKSEVFTFLTTSNATFWKKLPWDKITSLGVFMDPLPDELICMAHKYNVRVIKAADFSIKILDNTTAKLEFIKKQIEYAKQKQTDGINIDFEVSIGSLNPAIKQLSNFMKDLSIAFHKKIPGSKVSFDMPYSPDGTYGRNFDAVAFADAMDYLVLMCYDEFLGPYATANSDIQKTSYGVNRYLEIGVPKSKLIMAFPWYAHVFSCSNITKDNVCVINKHVTTLDMATVEDYYRKYAISEILWDKTAMSPFFNYKKNGVRGQIRYDNTKSLRLKNDVALSLGILGVSMWTANHGDDNNAIRWKEIWGTIPYNKFNLVLE